MWLVVATCLMAAPLAPQEPRSNLGLPAVSAIGVFGGRAWLERGSSGQEGGAVLDVGWLRGRGLRLQGEISLLSAELTETVLVEDTTYNGHYFDVTGSVTAVLLGGGPGARFAPYLLAGVGVHALSSTFGTIVLDQRYNANRFGSHVGGGVRIWLGSAGRRGVFLEGRRIISDEVNRTVVRVGGLMLFGDLVRPKG